MADSAPPPADTSPRSADDTDAELAAAVIRDIVRRRNRRQFIAAIQGKS